VFFRDGEYNPESDSGKKLIAHELTHVMQQTCGRQIVQRKGWDSENVNDLFEDAADVQNIQEFEVGQARSIKFTNMTSCIGLIAVKKEDDTLIGVHLFIDAEDKWVGNDHPPEDVGNAVSTELQGGYPVYIVGNRDVWSSGWLKENRPGAGRMLEEIEACTSPYSLTQGSGIYEAQLLPAIGEVDRLEIRKDGALIHQHALA
jgi:hypothetical protein